MARAAVTLATAGRYELIAGDTEHASQVTVFDGIAHVSGNGFDLDVRAGETAVLSGEQTIRAEVRAAGPADAFVAWVEAQERLHRRGAPAAASAMTGAAELGAYGRWARAAGYGDIWYPDVPAGWAPYREGYWAWVEPWGWTWIDEEAWGFAPFHYGRWLMIDDRWAWIPGKRPADEPIAAIYAPALVTFFTAADTCAWVPLGPGRGLCATVSRLAELFPQHQRALCEQYQDQRQHCDREDENQRICQTSMRCTAVPAIPS